MYEKISGFDDLVDIDDGVFCMEWSWELSKLNVILQ